MTVSLRNEHPTPAALRRGALVRAWFLDPFRLSLFLLVLISISRIHDAVPLIGRARPGLVLILIALAAAVLSPRNRLVPWVWTRQWQVKAVAALGALAILGAPFGLSLGASGYYFLNYYSKVLLVAILLMAAMRETQDLAAFVWSVVLGCGILVWMSVFLFHLSTEDGVARLTNLYTWDANELGALLLLGLPLAALLFQTSRGIPKIVSGVVTAAIGVSIARSGSRGAFLGFAVVAALFLVSLKRVSVIKRLAFVGVMIGTLAVAAPAGYWNQMSTLTQPTQDYNWNGKLGRKDLALRALHYMAERPVFGLGLANFSRAIGLTSDLAQAHLEGGAGVKWSVVHNSYLQAGAELGLPGLLLWLSLIAGSIIEPRRLRRRLPPAWRDGPWEERFLYHGGLFLSFSATGFGVATLFLSLTWQDPVYVLAALSLGYRVSVRKRLNQESLRRAPQLTSHGAGVQATPPRSRVARRPFAGVTRRGGLR